MNKYLTVVLIGLVLVSLNVEGQTNKDNLIIKGDTALDKNYELYTGVAYELYKDTNRVLREWTYVDGELTLLKFWYENGQLAFERTYKNGELDGLWKEWYENGQLQYEWNYKDGKEDGLHRMWYENGQLRYEYNYKDGKEDGLWKEWHENGKLSYESNYKNGVKID